MDATPTIAGDPRFIAGKRMRRAGRFEQAVQLLTEVLAVATEGKSEEEQLAPALAPVYYEYGVALNVSALKLVKLPRKKMLEKVLELLS